MLHLTSIFIVSVFALTVSSGRIDAQFSQYGETTTEKSHIKVVVEKSEPSVSEDHIKVMKMENGTVYHYKSNGRPEHIRHLHEHLHDVTQTDFDDNESTTSLRPESTSHSHVYERTAHTKTTVHKTKKEKTKSTTEMSQTIHHSRSKRSFTKEELESFSEMGKVFTESFKKFNDDAAKAQKDFKSFMTKLDEISASHDRY